MKSKILYRTLIVVFALTLLIAFGVGTLRINSGISWDEKVGSHLAKAEQTKSIVTARSELDIAIAAVQSAGWANNTSDQVATWCNTLVTLRDFISRKPANELEELGLIKMVQDFVKIVPPSGMDIFDFNFGKKMDLAFNIAAVFLIPLILIVTYRRKGLKFDIG